jgi:hypothetical protein
MTILVAPDAKELRSQEDSRLLSLIPASVAEIEQFAADVAEIETRLAAMVIWLDTNPGHPKYSDRFERAIAQAGKHEEALRDLYIAGATLHRRVDHLSAEGRRRANDQFPGVSEGINYARRVHAAHSPFMGHYYALLKGGTNG